MPMSPSAKTNAKVPMVSRRRRCLGAAGASATTVAITVVGSTGVRPMGSLSSPQPAGSSTPSAHAGSNDSSSVGSGGSAPASTSTTTTVVLSRPPWRLAISTNTSASICGSSTEPTRSAISWSGTSSTRPSLHNTKRSPRTMGRLHASQRTVGSMPKARVTMLRRG